MSNLDIIRGRQTVIPLTNKSGAGRSEGDVVIVDVANDDSFTTTVVAGNPLVCGVVAETIANNAEGRVIIAGYVATLAVEAATARGSYLKTSTTAAQATPAAASTDVGIFGIALSATGGAGNVSAFITGVYETGGGGGAGVGCHILTAAGGWPSTTSGCAEPAQVEFGTNDVDIYVLDFDATTQEHAQWTIGMPSDWDEGTITADFRWTAAEGSGNVIWGLQGRSYGDDDAIDQAWGAAGEITDTLLAAGDLMKSSVTAAITLAGTAAADETVQIRVYRKAADGGDTLEVDARLISVHIYYNRV